MVVHDVDVTNMDTPMISGGETFTQSLKKIVREAECRADGFKTPKNDLLINDERGFVSKLPAKRQYRRLSVADRADDDVPRPDLSFLTPLVVKEARNLALERSSETETTQIKKNAEKTVVRDAEEPSDESVVDNMRAEENLQNFEDEILNEPEDGK